MKRTNKNRIARFFVISFQLVSLVGVSVLKIPQIDSVIGSPQIARAAGSISGLAFHDYNADGVNNTNASATNPQVDRPLPGVTVTAYNDAGENAGSATTGADGRYVLNVTGDGPYRVEFNNLPVGFVTGKRTSSSVVGSSSTASSAGSSVQFVATANASNVNLAAVKPDEFCQANPMMATTCFVGGNQISSAHSAALSFPADAGNGDLTSSLNSRFDEPTAHPLNVPSHQLGTVYGLAFQPSKRLLFSSAFYKRHSGYGPNGPGAIYKIQLDKNNAGSTASLFYDFGAAAGPNLHNPADYAADWATNGSLNSWDAVGKTSLGDIDISPDESTLYVVNLFDRKLYLISTASASVISSHEFPLTLPGASVGCSAEYARPFGLGIKDNTLFTALVCTGPSASNLRAYVYKFDGVVFSGAPVLEYSLNYPRGCADKVGCAIGMTADWRAWETTFKATGRPSSAFIASGPNPASLVASHPQPMLTDIVFDNDGSMILGFRDRFGDQVGFNSFSDPSQPLQRYIATGLGDLQRACATSANSWVAPGTAQCPNKQNSGFGAGGGEYYYDDFYSDSHSEILLGGLTQIPGFQSIHTTAIDPIPLKGAYFSGGIRTLNNSSGAIDKVYRLYQSSTSPATFNFNSTVAKANGLGDLEPLCDAAPIELGNRVWLDNNANGIQDPSEAGISGVTVRLYRPGFGPNGISGDGDDNASLARAVTDFNGEYYFVNGAADSVIDHIGVVTNSILPNATYEIRLDNAGDRDSDEPLNGLSLTEQNDAAASPSGSDLNDSDAANVVNPVGSAAGTFPVIQITTSGPGASNHTLDFGFNSSVSVGNQVWFDLNNDGVVGATEKGVAGVNLDLFFDANGNGTLDAAEQTPISTTTTITDGFYLFRSGLSAGTYFVGINPNNFAAGGVLTGYLSSKTSINATGTIIEIAPATPNNDIDNDDNGSKQNGGFYDKGVLSGPITVGFNEPTNEVPTNRAEVPAGSTPGIVDPNGNTASNVTVDFGFYNVGVGNRVWFDLDDSGTRNGVEGAPNGVNIQLFSGDGATELPIGPDGVFGTTDDALGGMLTNASDGDGTYVLRGLPEGDYVVCLAPPAGYVSSKGPGSINEPAPDPDGEGSVILNFNGDDNGTFMTTGACAGKIASKAVTLNAGNEPNLRTPYFPAIGYTENGAVDFGLAPTIDATKFSIGNRVWIDTGAGANANNGVIDADERGAAGITVTLRLSNTLAQIAQTLTDLNGYYRFDNLDAGDYIVEVTQPAGYTPSAVSEADPDTNGDSNHNCVTSAAGTVRSAAVTLGPLADEPQNELDLASNGQGSDDSRANMTVDCGFVVPSHSLGNQVFNDANNNGMFDPATETNIGNVSINLYFDVNADGRVGSEEMSAPILTTTTNASGLYLFERLAPGNYMVELAASNFVTGGVLVGYASSSGAGGSASGPFEPSGDPDDPAAQADAKDFGSRALDGSGRTTIRSATVTINTNTEPLVNTALDGNGIPNDGVLDPIEIPIYDNDSATLDGNENLTVDFGVFKPYAVGNRVWFDSNDNGAMDGDEFGLPGVSMTLNTAAGALVATTTTDLNGYYSFDSLFAGDYAVCADIPSGMKSSTDIASSALPNNDIDKDENGVDLSNANKVCSASVTLGDAAGADTEPQNEPDPSLTDSSDARANLTVDFGFYEPVSLGSRVFFDEPNQGYRVSGQRNGVPSFTVSLYEDNNDDGLADGSAIAISETNFAGDYFFTGLRPGTYIVSIVPPAGQPFVSSSGRQGSLTGPYEGPSAIDPDFGPGGGINNDDNGITRSDGSVWGKSITLRSRDENAADSDTNPNVNRSYDFGFFKPLSLGNIVWDDLDDNGLKGASEPGIAGVQVNLYWDANNDGEVTLIERASPILTTTTDVNGLYLFTNLGAGNFVVELDPSAFAAGERLHGYISSDDVSAGTVGPYEPGPDPDDATGPNGNPIDQDDNGSNVNAAIQSKVVTLKADTEPTAEDPNNDSATSDKNSNLTVDFGVYRPFSIGNRVWMDENQNSKQDGSEQGAADVLVKLLLPDETIVGSTNTDAKGYYRFDALRAGEYIVEIDATNFISIGFGTAETAGPLYQLVNSAININDPNDDADQDDNGLGSSSVITGVRSGILKLGLGASEPDGESDVSDGGQGTEDNFANMTVDFGFHVNKPLAVTLDLFKASFAANGVVVNWRTSLERNTLGFNVWRSASGKRDDAVKINPSIIDAKGATGGTYEFFDASGAAGASYWLEEIELSGASIWYGAAVVGSPTNVSDSFDVASGGVNIQIVGATNAPVVVNEPSAPLQLVVRGSETVIRPSLRSSQESVSVAAADTNLSSASQTLAQVTSQQKLESQSRETVQVARDETTVASSVESNTSDEPKTLTAQASEQELSIIIERGSSEPSRLVVSAAPDQIKSTSRSPIPLLIGVWIGLMIFVGAFLLRKVYKMTR